MVMSNLHGFMYLTLIGLVLTRSNVEANLFEDNLLLGSMVRGSYLIPVLFGRFELPFRRATCSYSANMLPINVFVAVL